MNLNETLLVVHYFVKSVIMMIDGVLNSSLHVHYGYDSLELVILPSTSGSKTDRLSNLFVCLLIL